MTRTTRATLKAKETEIDIAEDITCSQAQDIVEVQTVRKTDSIRPPLVEMTANVVEELKQAIDAKNSGKDTLTGKKGRPGTKRAKSKQRELEQSSQADAGKSIPKGAHKDEKGVPRESTSPDANLLPVMEDSKSSSVVVKADSVVTQNTSSKDNFKDEEQTSKSADLEAQQAASTSKHDAAAPEAVQKLESIFAQPDEVVNEVIDNIEQGLPTLDVAASIPLPTSPLKRPSASPKRETRANTSKTLTAKSRAKSIAKSDNKCKAAATEKRKSTVAAAPHLSMRQAPRPSNGTAARTATTRKARPSSIMQVAPVSPLADGNKKERTIPALNTPPKPAKSSKAPTALNFQLPSEALKDKFKAQKEERQKRQEEQAQKQKENVTGPSIPLKRSTKPRVPAASQPSATVAHQPRPSMSGTVKKGSPTNFAARKPPATRAATVKSVRRTSTLNPPTSNTVREHRPPGGRISSVTKPTLEETIMTAAKKAEAAKKARADAAEKGRAASREWAEKKKREATAKKTKNAEVKVVEAQVAATATL